MTASRFVSAILLLIAAAARGNAAEQAVDRPNVILIVADDLGWADLGCYGSKFHRTPHLDEMANQGVRFTDAYAACPVCSPTRAALMTGKWPARLHLTDWLPGRGDRPDQRMLRPRLRQELPLEEVTLAEHLKRAGYATGHFGKWHLGGDGFGPEEQGFDTNIAGDHTGTPLSYFAPYRSERGGQRRTMPGLEEAPDGEYLTDRLTSEAKKFIDAHREQPFFLYLPHYAVHTPLKAPQDRVDQYPGEMKLGEQSNPIYAAMLESVDRSVGQIRQKIAEHGLSERTLIIFTSDNGGLATLEGPNTPATINAPLREGKGYLYEGGIRVPLIVAWPGRVRADAESKQPVITQDLFATALAACGAAPEASSDGVNLLPLLEKNQPLERKTLYWHYPHYSNQGGRPGGAIRDGDLKLIEFYDTGRRELYDVAKDSRESRNLAAERPDEVTRLAAKLHEWRTQVGAQAMAANPEYVPNPQAADGTITLPAKTADVTGSQLRFEPLPHKNTLGFWTLVDDHAQWEFTVTKPGKFEVEVWQGCGEGQGGSEVVFEVAGQSLPLTVVDTGHFQNFQPQNLGVVELPEVGRVTLTVRAKTKAKAAVMDIRQIVLKRVAP